MPKQSISVPIDTQILDYIDQVTSDREAVIDEALRLWCDRHNKAQAQRVYDAQRRYQDQDETGWLV